MVEDKDTKLQETYANKTVDTIIGLVSAGLPYTLRNGVVYIPISNKFQNKQLYD
jgi:hypothetical protein